MVYDISLSTLSSSDHATCVCFSRRWNLSSWPVLSLALVFILVSPEQCRLSKLVRPLLTLFQKVRDWINAMELPTFCSDFPWGLSSPYVNLIIFNSHIGLPANPKKLHKMFIQNAQGFYRRSTSVNHVWNTPEILLFSYVFLCESTFKTLNHTRPTFKFANGFRALQLLSREFSRKIVTLHAIPKFGTPVRPQLTSA